MGGGSRLLWVMGLGTIKILDHPSTVKIIMKVVCLDLADVCDFFHSGVPMGYCGLRGGGNFGLRNSVSPPQGGTTGRRLSDPPPDCS